MSKPFGFSPEQKDTFTTKTNSKHKTRSLLTGVSAVAMMLGVAHGSARAAGITVTGVTSDVFVSSASTVDFIDIDGGIVTNSIFNDGTIGFTDVGIEVRNGGLVGDQIVNASKGTVSASKTGIAVRGDTPGLNAIGNSIVNEGLINVINASAISTPAYGINVTGSGILTSLSNGGTINVSLTGSGTGTHPAVGVNIVSSGILNANVSNSGQVDVEAFWGTGPGAQNATATGINISNTAQASSVGITLFNAGDIYVDATAVDSFISNGLADAQALGVGLAGAGSASVTKLNVNLYNTKNGWISAEASAYGAGSSTANVGARATGARVSALGGVFNNVNLSNSGYIHASANAFASAPTAAANATAFGTQQVGFATKATFFNGLEASNNSSGTINASAKAVVHFQFNGTASASAQGAPQFGVGGDILDISFDNSGLIDVNAFAGAWNGSPTGTGNANAFGLGAFQSGVATASTTKNFLDFFNSSSGDIDVKVTAVATKAFEINATAVAGGISQIADGGTIIDVSNYNSGNIDVIALAVATKGVTSAEADAFAFGTKQFAIGTGGNTIFNGVFAGNDGTIDVTAIAYADSVQRAYAEADAFGVPQFAVGGSVVEAVYWNDGLIDVNAYATVTKNGTGWADAFALGGGQVAIATTKTVYNTAVFYNQTKGGTGVLTIDAVADAGASKSAKASAGAGGIGQSIIGGQYIYGLISNNGLVDVNAQASAHGTFTSDANYADANAYAWGTKQVGVGTAGNTLVNDLNVFNNGAIVANASAKATASISADADAFAIAAPQIAIGGQTITVNMTNSGFLGAGAGAIAVSANSNWAFASAVGAAQYGVATTLTNSVSLNLTNTTSGTISASAFAGAGFGIRAHATVSATGVSQSAANPYGSVSVTFNNNGLVDVYARAIASPAGTATADASAIGSQQFGLAGPTGSNTLSANNSGVFDVDAEATAFGTFAAAYATAFGAPQTAVGGMTINILENNSGTINVNATASASGLMTATVYARAVGAYQAGSGTSATVTNSVNLMNTTSGVIDVSANATGVTAGGTDNTASATAVGVSQYASMGASVLSTISNNGYIEVDAFASASGITPWASANAGGLIQGATGSALSTFVGASIINSASGTITVYATGVATDGAAVSGVATAWATAVGIAQGLTGGVSQSGSITNDGLVDVNAGAYAFGGSVSANATAAGIAQGASGTAATTNTNLNITNSASGIVDVNAYGSYAGSFAFASSIGAVGAVQAVLGGGDVSAVIDNYGSIDAQGQAWAVGAAQFGGFGTGTSAAFTVNNYTSAYLGAHASVGQFGTAANPAHAYASAVGVSQGVGTTIGSAGVDLTLNVWNAGVLDVDAGASGVGASATASAVAAAVNQFVSATAAATNIALAITNAKVFIPGTTTLAPGTTVTGSITVNAVASASGANVSATADGANGGAAAFAQQVAGAPVGSNVTIGLTNQGDITTHYQATAKGASAYANVDRVAGFWQTISGSASTASATVVNSSGAVFSHNGTAYATGASAPRAYAAVPGGWQTVNADGAAFAGFTNNGTFNVNAIATATGANPDATGVVTTGIYQFARGNNAGTGSSGTVSLTNTSFLSLNLNASAHATGTGTPSATASIGTGIYQEAQGETATATINNSGAINMDVFAFASNTGASGDAFAKGTIDTGIYQSANANDGDNLSASATLVNSGDLVMSARATAIAPDAATASANIDIGIGQYVSGGDNVSASITNTTSGDISFSAIAKASGDTAKAYASNDTHVFEQQVTAGDDLTSSTISVLNDGTISVLLSGNAYGTDGASGVGNNATASGFASYQFQGTANDGAVSSTTFVNNGTIDVMMLMNASHASHAQASADFDTGFDYEAYANTAIANGSATVTFTNNGDINWLGQAVASGVTSADADATLAYLFSSTAANASTATYSWTNSATGSISLDLYATAIAAGNGVTGNAYAYVFMDTINEADANAAFGDQASVSSSMVNNGMIDVNLVARAFGTNVATATASQYYGFSHNAINGDTATSSFTNAGDINVNLLAYASANDAYAEASFTSYFLYSSANASDDRISASATFTNTLTGTISVLAQATARGTDGSSGMGATASAFATIEVGISQYAFDANTVSASITNDGTMSFLAHALASNASSATASASIGYGFQQSATADGTAGSTATVTVTNTSLVSLNFDITAQAYGGTFASASAEFDDTIIEQDVFNAETAVAEINNSGLINVFAGATASATDGSAYAYASIDYGFSQSATATGGDDLLASVEITNSGIINLIAVANATGWGTGTTSDTAYAFATVDSAFYQDADNADVISATLTNDGEINVIAMANAQGRDASAVASVGSDVFDQEVYNGTGSGNDQVSSTALFENTGDITVLAQAVAHGTDGSSGLGRSATAFASVSTFISQTAGGSDAVSAIINNDGTINVSAIAIADNAVYASASASIGYGIYHYATGHNAPGTGTASGADTAVATFTNTSNLSLNFLVLAQATGSTNADAYAEFDDTIIYQSADGASDATALIDNSGTFTVLVQANALATNGDASATVSIDYGISQFAFADAGTTMTASATFNNSGTFSIIGIANATGSSGWALASATLNDIVFSQSGTAGGAGSSGTAAINNSGGLTFGLMANANGSSWADAEATFESDIFEQYALGETATASFDNSGTLNIWAVANATATNGWASADAYFSNSIFEQDASGTSGNLSSVASTNFTNSGTILITGLASANGTSWASATASAYNDLVDQRAWAATASTSFNNSGTLSFILDAQASATNGWASADASMTETVFDMSASAPTWAFGTSGVASVSFENSGTISLLVRASATGTSWASASATFDSEILDLWAGGGSTATNTFTNSGTFNVTALAFASATNGWASADVSFDDTIIDQSAWDWNAGTGSSATASFTNSGTFAILGSAVAYGTSWASASASNSSGLFDQDAYGHTASASFNNSGTFSFILNAHAVATNGWASADASIDESAVIEQSASTNSYGGGSAIASFVNSGTFTVGLRATATGTSWADASATISEEFFDQWAGGAGATASFSNSGTFNVFMSAIANASSGWASADVSFESTVFDQYAWNGSANPASTATASFSNSGTLTLRGFASANATNSWASAQASYDSELIDQTASGLNANVSISNSGTFNAMLTALANAATNTTVTRASAWAFASFEDTMFDQHASATGGAGSVGTVTFTNSGTMNLSAIASANGVFGTTFSPGASATVSAEVAHQYAQGETASVDFTNSGNFSVLLSANASALSDSAFASASLDTGIYQQVTASQGAMLSAAATFNNSGLLSFDVNAGAVASQQATAYAYLNTAIWQWAGSGATISVNLNNSGSIIFDADAHATGGTYALATATATNVWQTVNPSATNTDATLTFTNTNSGSFSASANATANNTGGTQAFAFAYAGGVSQFNQNPGTQPLATFNFSNAGDFTVSAFASAFASSSVSATAFASATGYIVWPSTNSTPFLNVSNTGTLQVNATALGGLVATATAVGMSFNGGSLAGSVSNAGTINVTASASAANTANALALGVVFNAPVNNTTFTNTGTIAVLAIGSTTATAIRYNNQSGHAFTATASDLATFINDGGTLWAGHNDGTLDFGNVINTTMAPHPVFLNFQGSSQQGNVWGNAMISPDDNILFSNGNTIWRGMINSSLSYVGSLTISDDGTLTMPTVATGPFVAYVDNYTQTSDGTLAVNIYPSTGTNDLGQINAITADLDGVIQANIVAGLYADSMTYQDVVVASTLTGTWSNAQVNTNTPLLTLFAIYPGDDTADLGLQRNAFDSVAGMTINQTSAAGAIENVYSTSLTGPFATLVGDLFTLDTAAYIAAIEQLHGSEYAQNLRTNMWSMDLLQGAVGERLNAGTFSDDLSNNSSSIIRRGETNFWAKYQGVWGDLEGDVEAPGYDQTQHGVYAGVDHALSDDFLAGFAVGYYRNELDFTNGSHKEDDGVQIGLYGAYDNQTWYVRGLFGMGFYNADSMRRPIDIVSTTGTPLATYDVTVFTGRAEIGRRFEIGNNTYFTPFGGFGYTTAKNDAFSETGVPGANLAVDENKAKSFTSDLGARLSAAFESGNDSLIIPEIGFRWRHEFKDGELVTINSAFDGVAGSGFPVISSLVDEDMFIVDGSIAFTKGDRFEARIGYTGRFNSQITDHGVGLRITVLLGN